jgi:hypothetical protein
MEPEFKKSLDMKKLICLLFVLTAINYGQSNTLDEGKLIAKTKVVKQDVIHFTLANLKGLRTNFTLTNLDEKTIYYSKGIKNRNGFSTNLNVSDLEDGKYLLNIKNGDTKLRQVIRIKDGLILFSRFR